MAHPANLLGEFLRARRDMVSPESLGLPQLGLRRVRGLRREEVAMLAGISADYYLRLEQGRDRSPSRQVLESIARVLQLDEDATAYLLSLGLAQGASRPRAARKRPRKESVPTGIRLLLDTIELPAFVEGRYLDVLAANPYAAALSPRLVPGGNRLRDLFLDPAEQDLYPDWQEASAQIVAGFRESVGTDVEDPRFIELVGALSLASPRFRELWARHDVAHREGAMMRLDHPHVGELTLYREKLAISGTVGQMLVIYHPEPGTSNADKLALLVSYTLPARNPGGQPTDAPRSLRTLPTAFRDRRQRVIVSEYPPGTPGTSAGRPRAVEPAGECAAAMIRSEYRSWVAALTCRTGPPPARRSGYAATALAQPGRVLLSSVVR